MNPRSAQITSCAVAILLCFGVSGCRSSLERKLKSASSLTLYYYPFDAAQGKFGKKKSVSINGANEVRPMLSKVALKSISRNVQSLVVDKCGVIFHFDDGSEIHTKFGHQEQLVYPKGWAILYLRDAGFYDAVCEALSKAEKKPVDPWKERKHRGQKKRETS